MSAVTRIPIGATVRHIDASPRGMVGVVTRHLRSSVGAPYMVRVQWTERHSAPVNERSLVVVDDR
jgi:hypothetical protein